MSAPGIDSEAWKLQAAAYAVALGFVGVIYLVLPSGAMEIRDDGEMSVRVKALNAEIFETPIDEKEWAKRMTEGKSLSLCTEHGFLLAHQREDEKALVVRDPKTKMPVKDAKPNTKKVVNVWLAGVVSDARGKGDFRRLVDKLLWKMGFSAQFTMTTRPEKFVKMFEILRCAP